MKLEVAVTLKRKITYILGNESKLNSGQLSDEIFSDNTINLLEQLSKRILKDKNSGAYPDLVAFGFFIRKANLSLLKKRYLNESNRFGRGLVFHIAPSNVALNFAYSMTASLLSGNSNIIRLASKDFPQTDQFIKLIQECAKENSCFLKKLCLIRYERNDQINEYYSKLVDGRVIWGGDATVRYFRQFETKPRCVDVMFSNRNSLLIIDSKFLLGLTEKELGQCTAKFIQDALFFEQNACTSPKIIYFKGNNEDNEMAKALIWSEFLKYDLRDLNIKGKETTDKLMKVIDLALKNEEINYKKHGLVDVIAFNKINDVELMSSNRFGLFYELAGNDLSSLADIMDDRTQTISYIASEAEPLFKQLIDTGLNQFDRIVPIGKSSDFDMLWDGYDLITTLSRRVSVI